MAEGPRNDEFASLLGIEVVRRGPGHTVASMTTAAQHANPHGTVHGAVFYAVADRLAQPPERWTAFGATGWRRAFYGSPPPQGEAEDLAA